MIFIDRTKIAPPAVLMDDVLKSGGPQETKKAIAFYKKRANHGKPFAYKAYGHQDVRNALENLFQGKCSYCESRYRHVQPMEVEHWRPKGEVEQDGTKIKPGYYWLAATWDNLLPSCIDCNRQRYHKVGDSDGTPVLLGKKNSFPLQQGSTRATKAGEETTEIPLLLHPCKDNPQDYLEFVVEKKPQDADDLRGMVRAASATGLKFDKAKASIEVYALGRVELNLERKERLIFILAQIERVEEAVQRLEQSGGVTPHNQRIYEREMKFLLDYQEEKEPYALMARQVIGAFLRGRV